MDNFITNLRKHPLIIVSSKVEANLWKGSDNEVNQPSPVTVDGESRGTSLPRTTVDKSRSLPGSRSVFEFYKQALYTKQGGQLHGPRLARLMQLGARRDCLIVFISLYGFWYH